MNKTDITYSIGAVAKIVGIPKYKLRNWKDRWVRFAQLSGRFLRSV